MKIHNFLVLFFGTFIATSLFLNGIDNNLNAFSDIKNTSIIVSLLLSLLLIGSFIKNNPDRRMSSYYQASAVLVSEFTHDTYYFLASLTPESCFKVLVINKITPLSIFTQSSSKPIKKNKKGQKKKTQSVSTASMTKSS